MSFRLKLRIQRMTEWNLQDQTITPAVSLFARSGRRQEAPTERGNCSVLGGGGGGHAWQLGCCLEIPEKQLTHGPGTVNIYNPWHVPEPVSSCSLWTNQFSAIQPPCMFHCVSGCQCVYVCMGGWPRLGGAGLNPCERYHFNRAWSVL